MSDKKVTTKDTVKKVNTKDLAPSVRFSNMVLREYEQNTALGAQMTDGQKRIVQNYFIVSDRVIEEAEQRRLAKTGKWQDKVPVSWNTVDMQAFALDAAYYSKLGLDPLQKNHLHIIPFKNNKTGKYDLNLMEGYSGMELIAMKYAHKPPLAVIVELIYSNDKFTAHKKSLGNEVENYDFEISNPFDRGELQGGFAYIQYDDARQNKLLLYSKADIEKRKSSGHGNVEFWGGEKDKWEWDKAQNKNVKKGKEQVDGWYEEMALKTIKRAVFGGSHIPIDPEKIDAAYQYAKQKEVDREKALAQSEIDTYANQGDLIDADTMEIVEGEFTEIMEVENVGQIEELAAEETEGKGDSRTADSSKDATSEPASTGKQTTLEDEPF